MTVALGLWKRSIMGMATHSPSLALLALLALAPGMLALDNRTFPWLTLEGIGITSVKSLGDERDVLGYEVMARREGWDRFITNDTTKPLPRKWVFRRGKDRFNPFYLRLAHAEHYQNLLLGMDPVFKEAIERIYMIRSLTPSFICELKSQPLRDRRSWMNEICNSTTLIGHDAACKERARFWANEGKRMADSGERWLPSSEPKFAAECAKLTPQCPLFLLPILRDYDSFVYCCTYMRKMRIAQEWVVGAFDDGIKDFVRKYQSRTWTLEEEREKYQEIMSIPEPHPAGNRTRRGGNYWSFGGMTAVSSAKEAISLKWGSLLASKRSKGFIPAWDSDADYVMPRQMVWPMMELLQKKGQPPSGPINVKVIVYKAFTKLIFFEQGFPGSGGMLDFYLQSFGFHPKSGTCRLWEFPFSCDKAAEKHGAGLDAPYPNWRRFYASLNQDHSGTGVPSKLGWRSKRDERNVDNLVPSCTATPN